MKTLLLFTNSFPFPQAQEDTFLVHEVDQLSRVFDKIIIIPHNSNGQQTKCTYPNVLVDVSLAQYLEANHAGLRQKVKQLLRIFFSRHWNSLEEILNFSKIKRKIKFLCTAELVEIWFSEYYKKFQLSKGRVLLYTYWTTSTTYGLARCKQYYSGIKVISRAHGIDLYEERGFVVLRHETLRLIDQIHLVSREGIEYLSKLYGGFVYKIFFSPLGVSRNLPVNIVTDTRNFVIVSCSQITRVKRVELIAQALQLISIRKLRGIDKIVWFHFGDGELKEKVIRLKESIKTKTIEVILYGQIPNLSLLEFYSKQQVNLFVNCSSSEGRPVSIMEALSFGIPILATRVGGVPEMVDQAVGKLLSPNPLPKEVADGICFFIDNPGHANRLRLAAIKKWEADLNAEKNFQSFAESIATLVC